MGYPKLTHEQEVATASYQPCDRTNRYLCDIKQMLSILYFYLSRQVTKKKYKENIDIFISSYLRFSRKRDHPQAVEQPPTQGGNPSFHCRKGRGLPIQHTTNHNSEEQDLDSH